jgi:hypothetical protein
MILNLFSNPFDPCESVAISPAVSNISNHFSRELSVSR